eukprot:scaffold2795_cov106-Isochrysis_galbana.AAC.7
MDPRCRPSSSSSSPAGPMACRRASMAPCAPPFRATAACRSAIVLLPGSDGASSAGPATTAGVEPLRAKAERPDGMPMLLVAPASSDTPPIGPPAAMGI